METLEYIKQHSEFYKTLPVSTVTDEVVQTYCYIPDPTREQMQSQIKLHMFWQIPLPVPLLAKLEYYMKQGIFFREYPDVYLQLDKRYLSLVRCYTRLTVACPEPLESDFTYSMELYKKAPVHFNLKANNYNSIECLEQIPLPANIDHAVVIGSIECIEYLQARGCDMHQVHMLATYYDQPQLLPYFEAKGIKCNNVVAEVAAVCGNVKCLDYLDKAGLINDLHMIIAMSKGNLEAVKFLHTCGIPWTTSLRRAVEQNHVECVKYAIEHGAPMLNATEAAANRGNISMLELLRTMGAQWEESIMFAAYSGELETIKYLHQHGAQWYDAAACASGAGHIACLDYMHKQGVPLADAMVVAIRVNRIQSIEYILLFYRDWLAKVKECIADGRLRNTRIVEEPDTIQLQLSIGSSDARMYMILTG